MSSSERERSRSPRGGAAPSSKKESKESKKVDKLDKKAAKAEKKALGIGAAARLASRACRLVPHRNA